MVRRHLLGDALPHVADLADDPNHRVQTAATATATLQKLTTHHA